MIHDPCACVPCLLCHRLILPSPHPILGDAVCEGCLEQKCYETANTQQVGEADGLPMFSVEFEVCACAYYFSDRYRAERALTLLRHGYLRTHDLTVQDEYKSPRYLDLAEFQKVLSTMDGLSDLVDHCCGTHIHIDCPVHPSVLVHEGQIFAPLAAYLCDHEQETKRFWGRQASGRRVAYASRHYQTIEFRLPRFRTAEQYLRVVRFCRAVGSLLERLLSRRFEEDHPSSPPPHPSLIGTEIVALYQRWKNEEVHDERSELYV